MKIAVSINGQFSRMTGIQHYVDSLLNGLYAVNTRHELTAFAPDLWSGDIWDVVLKEGLFQWRQHPAARVDAAGNDFVLKCHPLARRSPRVHVWANRFDSRIINPIKTATMPRRNVRASRRYDLMHIPEASHLEFLDYEARCNVATIYDITTITCPDRHIPTNVASWGRYYDYAKNHCARVLTISEFSKADIVAHLGIPADRVDVTPLAPRASTRRVTDFQEIGPVLDKFGLAGAPFVLYAGTLEPRKNLRRLVDAFAQAVADARLPDCKLVMAGGAWDDYDQDLHARAGALGLGGRLVTTGYVSNAEMNALMSSCAAFVYVSEYEGFGLPPLEAMVCGAPVVASNTTSLPEVVGDAGIQVDPADVGAIAGALHLLLTDGAENARRRALSLERAKLFSWERTARLTLQSYEAAVL